MVEIQHHGVIVAAHADAEIGSVRGTAIIPETLDGDTAGARRVPDYQIVIIERTVHAEVALRTGVRNRRTVGNRAQYFPIQSNPPQAISINDGVTVVGIVGVSAQASDQQVSSSSSIENVISCSAIQDILAGRARQGVGSGVAIQIGAKGVGGRAIDRRVARQHQNFDIVADGIGHRRLDRVETAAVGQLFDDVPAVVYPVGIVAAPPDHPIRATLAVEEVVGTVAGDSVVQVVAYTADGGRANQLEVFHILSKGIA